MAESYSTESLDYWRKFFSCANADIFQVIKYAILVASADCPAEFLPWRDQITEILYTCWPMQCSRYRGELQTPEGGDEDDESSEDTEKESKESKSSSSEENEPTTSNEPSTSNRREYSNIDEFEALTDEIEEEQQTVGEVLRIKGLLTNWKEEPEKDLSESLRRLQLMELSVETLSATDIGRAVSGLYKHKSKPIRQLSQTLVRGWKLLAEEWVTATTISEEPSPISVDPSPAKEESLLLSELDFPPLDMGALLATQTASFEFSNFFEEMDDDGNITNMGDLKKDRRKPQDKDGTSSTKDCGEVRRHEVPKHPKPTDANHKASKPINISGFSVAERPSAKATACSNPQPRQKAHEHLAAEVRMQKVEKRLKKPTDATCKPSRPQDVPSPEVHDRSLARAAAHRNTQQRQRPSTVQSDPLPSRKDARVTNHGAPKQSEELTYQNKLEVTKRKLQDRYQEAKDAKRQRKIQVMELEELPKQCQNKLQADMKRGSYFKRRMNFMSR